MINCEHVMKALGRSHIHYLLYGDIMTWSKQTRDLAFNIVMFAGPQNKQLMILAGCLNLTHFQSKKDQALCQRLQPRYILRSFAISVLFFHQGSNFQQLMSQGFGTCETCFL